MRVMAILMALMITAGTALAEPTEIVVHDPGNGDTGLDRSAFIVAQ
jgi:hypothetical protein